MCSRMTSNSYVAENNLESSTPCIQAWATMLKLCVVGIEPRASCKLGKRSTNRAVPPVLIFPSAELHITHRSLLFIFLLC